MNKFKFSFVFGLVLAISSSLEAVDVQKVVPPAAKTEAPKEASQATVEAEKYQILKTDQIDPTSSLAIPFDDSEVEDEEEVNQIEGKKVFDLPKAQ